MIRSFPTTLMQDPVFRLRTPDARLVLFTLWMHPSNHLSGLFVLDLDHLALDVRLPLERSTPALRELTDHGLVLRHAPLDQLWLPRMAALLGNLGNGDAPVHKAVSKYVHGLVPSTLCHRVLDSLSIPYRNAADLPDLCAWLPADGCSVPQVTPSDTLSTRVPARVLSVSVSGSGLDSGSGTGSEKGTQREPAKPPGSAEPQGGLPGIVVANPKRTKKKPADPMPGTIILGAYTEAFLGRYKVSPPIDNRTRKHFANIAKNAIVGRAETVSEQAAIQEACGVAARYVGHPNAYYAQQSHPPGLLDQDWHKLVTEYRTGRTVTATTARDHERSASNPILEFAAEVRAQEEAAKRRKADVINVDE